MPSVSDFDILGESPNAEVDRLELGVPDDVVARVPPAQPHSQHLGRYSVVSGNYMGANSMYEPRWYEHSLYSNSKMFKSTW